MKSNVDQRIRLVEQYLRGETSLAQATEEASVSIASFRRWVSIYKNEGHTGLLPVRKNKAYSKELKLEAVLDYLNGSDGLEKVAQKYGLRDKRQLQDWIKRYTTHGNFKSESGGSYVSQTKNFSLEERLKMVLYCIAHGYDYSGTAVHYQVTYANLYSWVKRYEKKGKAGLEDRRGRRKTNQKSRTPEEEAQIKIAQLEEQVKKQQMEIDVLKKVKELERRDR